MGGLVPSEPAFGLLYHLTERVYEQVTASITCFATKQAAGAEVSARVALESSVNVRFILQDDRNSRALAWLRAYVDQDRKQIEQWQKLVDTCPPAERSNHQPRVATRRQVNEHRREFLRSAELWFSKLAAVDLNFRWPSIAERFSQIGEATAYRTAYARLSSQTHADAEDSINYMIAVAADNEDLLHQMSEETVAFSEFLALFAVRFYLLALRDLCTAFRLDPSPKLSVGLDFASENMELIGRAWEW